MNKLLNALSFTTLLVSGGSEDSHEDSMKFSEINNGGWTSLDGSSQIYIDANREKLEWIIHDWDGNSFAFKVLEWEMTSNTSKCMEGELKFEDISIPVKLMRSGENLKVQMFASSESSVLEFDKWKPAIR